MFLLIALAHAIPVFIAAAVAEKRSSVIWTALVMIAIGVMTGNPAYAALDIIAVAAVTWLCLSNMEDKQ